MTQEHRALDRRFGDTSLNALLLGAGQGAVRHRPQLFEPLARKFQIMLGQRSIGIQFDGLFRVINCLFQGRFGFGRINFVE